MSPIKTLWHYFRAKQLVFKSRQQLEKYQIKKLQKYLKELVKISPYFKDFSHLPFNKWPIMDKTTMMANFDSMNTAGLELTTVLSCALESEKTRDFLPKIGNISVGLSSGTSGTRGVFVVSPEEQRLWVGTVLAKLLPSGLFAGERVALFLRADNNLYQAVNNRWLSLQFFDLFTPFIEQYEKIQLFNPTIIIAPAQVLCALAKLIKERHLKITPKKVISAAEVLEPQDKKLLESVFSEVGEIYQATEGFLGATCSQGVLHLNEEYVFIEPQWLDEQRFIPLITDFSRKTQPIIRYRLDDILVKRLEPCLCGNPAMAIERIQGRCDDQLILLDEKGREVTVFADLCSRALAQILPIEADYRLIHTHDQKITLLANTELEVLKKCQTHLEQVFIKQGVDIKKLVWSLETSLPEADYTNKRRRIIHIKG